MPKQLDTSRWQAVRYVKHFGKAVVFIHWLPLECQWQWECRFPYQASPLMDSLDEVMLDAEEKFKS